MKFKIKKSNPLQPLKVVDTNVANVRSPKSLSKRTRENEENEAKTPKTKKLAAAEVAVVSLDKKAAVTSDVPPATLYEVSVVLFEALSAMEREEGSCVILAPHIGEDSGTIQITAVADDQVTQVQLVLLLQRLFTGLLKPAKTERHAENLIRSWDLSARLACFTRPELEVMLGEFLPWLIRNAGDTDHRLTRHSILLRLKSSLGWKANIFKKSVDTLFDNLAKAANCNSESLGEQELLVILRRVLDGSVKVTDIAAHKKILKMFL